MDAPSTPRQRLIELIERNITEATERLKTTDLYSRKQLESYIHYMKLQLNGILNRGGDL